MVGLDLTEQLEDINQHWQLLSSIILRAWKAIVDSLVEEKSKFVFGLIANPWEFWDYLADTDIKPILVRHEISSVFMAMAHARLTGRPGICMNRGREHVPRIS